MTMLCSPVLFAADLSRAAAFYRAAGIPLEDEEHDDGPAHVAADLDGVHIAVYTGDGEIQRAHPRRSTGSAFPGFYVNSLDTAQDALLGLEAPILEEHDTMPWGCRIVAEDPDGRAVEIIERHHCELRGE